MPSSASARPRSLTRRSAIVLTAAGGALVAARLRAAAQELTPLRLASPPDDNTSVALYAMSGGIFAKHGLDVRLQKMNNGAATAAAVAGGAADIGKTSLVALLQAHERGIPFVMVAGAGLFEAEHPTSGFVVAADGPIRAVPQLNGKTVSVPSIGSLDQAAVESWVQRAGGDPTSVKFVELPTTAALAAVESGRVDGANVQSPVFGEAKQNPKFRVLGSAYAAVANRFLISAWFGTRSYVTSNRAAMRRFVDAMREATTFAVAHPEATAPLLAAYSGIPQAVIEKMERQPVTVGLEDKEIQPVIDIAVSYKMLKASFPASDLVLRP